MQKDTVEVIINEGGKSCTTLNRSGEKPDPKSRYYKCGPFGVTNSFHIDYESWQQAESERKTYEIVCSFPYDCQKSIVCGCKAKYKEGTIHKAQIINNKAVIQ